MIKVKTLPLGPTGIPGHWFYGPEHMARVSRKTAAALCGMYPLPEMGEERTVAIARDRGFALRAMVQNISGDYFIACSNVKLREWPEVFKIEVISKGDAE